MSVAEALAEKIANGQAGHADGDDHAQMPGLLIDIVGLCVTARHEDYVASALKSCDDDGICTAIGHVRTLTATGAAFVNGTAAHGEDFDDTFEGGPCTPVPSSSPRCSPPASGTIRMGAMALVGIASVLKCCAG